MRLCDLTGGGVASEMEVRLVSHDCFAGRHAARCSRLVRYQPDETRPWHGTWWPCECTCHRGGPGDR